jgi:arylsulfatase A-like enzyme
MTTRPGTGFYPAGWMGGPSKGEDVAQYLKSFFRSSLSNVLAGITAGVLLGTLSGALFIAANRYLGFPRLALDSFREILNRYALGMTIAFLVLSLGWVLAARSARLRWALKEVRRVALAVIHRLAGVGPVGAALVLLVSINAAAGLLDETPRPRLNILLITIDTLRADHLSAYGYGRPTSPNLDRLAKQGVLFWRAASQWPKTTPSFASMMSSTWPHTNGLIRTTALRMPDRFLMLAELLKSGGYDTRAAVANPNLATVFNFDQGFDTYLEVWKDAERNRTELVTQRGLDLLRDTSRDRPFFYWLHYFDPHARYEPPARFAGLFVNDKLFDPTWRVPLQRERRKDIGGIPTTASLGNDTRVDYYVARYDAEIRAVDEQVGVLLRELERRGLADNTLVVVTADHGESLGDHNYFFEHGRFPYDSCVRVPLIVRGPGTGAPGRILRSPVGLIDLAPTLLDLAGLPANPEAQGKSLRRLLNGERVGSSRWAFTFTESGYAKDYQRSVTSERYKLVSVPDPEDRKVMKGSDFELYDLQKDPGETRNVIGEQPKVAEALKKQLDRWIVESGAPSEAPAEVSLDRDTEEQLRSLGYL